MLQPALPAHLPNPILADVHHDDPKTNRRRRDKQTLGRMQKAGAKRPRVEVKPTTDHGNVEQEEHHVADEEDAAQSVQPLEPEGHGVQHVCEPAGRHGEAEPRPGEVADALAPGEFGVAAVVGGERCWVLRARGGGGSIVFLLF